MRLEKAAGPDDQGLAGHGGAFGTFPKCNRKLLEVPLIFRTSTGRLWNVARIVSVC